MDRVEGGGVLMPGSQHHRVHGHLTYVLGGSRSATCLQLERSAVDLDPCTRGYGVDCYV